jgi:hypothetical protein
VCAYQQARTSIPPENRMPRNVYATVLASILAAATVVAAGCAGAHQSTQPIAVAAAPIPAPAPAPTVDIDALRTNLAARRALNLQRLHAYATAGVFPKNRHSDSPLNVFIDEDGHVCAAANLIDLDGHGDLVRATAASNNFLVLRDVTSGPLMDWMLTSGFTQEEIALIQEPYMPAEYEPPQPEPQPAVAEPTFAEPPLAVIAKQWEAEERERLQGVLLGVHAVLSANTAKSLTIAMDRLAAQPALMASLAQPVDQV